MLYGPCNVSNPKYDGLDFLNALYGISRECNRPDKHHYGEISHDKVENIKQKGSDSEQIGGSTT